MFLCCCDPGSWLQQEVTPWEVKGNEEGKIDYAKLVREVSELTVCRLV